MAASDPTNIILGICITFPALAIIAVSARFYARKLQNVWPAADDWLILLALFFCVGSGITGLIGLYSGDLGIRQPKGKNGFAIPSPKLATFKKPKVNYAAAPIFICCITFAKLSVLFFYRRIFTAHNFRIPFDIALTLNIVYGVSFFFVYIFQCIPVSQNWQTQIGQTRTCVDPVINPPFVYGDAILDFITIVLPLPYLRRMQMPRNRMLAVIGIFLLGAVVLAASVAKAVAFNTTLKNIIKDRDITYDGAPIFYWTISESCWAVIAACLPTLRPIFGGWSPESIVGNIRSMESLASLDSQGHRINNIDLAKNYEPDRETTKTFPKALAAHRGSSADTCGTSMPHEHPSQIQL